MRCRYIFLTSQKCDEFVSFFERFEKHQNIWRLFKSFEEIQNDVGGGSHGTSVSQNTPHKAGTKHPCTSRRSRLDIQAVRRGSECAEAFIIVRCLRTFPHRHFYCNLAHDWNYHVSIYIAFWLMTGITMYAIPPVTLPESCRFCF